MKTAQDFRNLIKVKGNYRIEDSAYQNAADAAIENGWPHEGPEFWDIAYRTADMIIDMGGLDN